MPDDPQHPIFSKIAEGTVTADDFNQLISEATPEAVRDRVRRRTTINPSSSHIDSPSGHQSMTLPNFAGRVQPKREKSNQTQMTGRGKAAHKQSTRTQRRKAKAVQTEETQSEDILERAQKMVDDGCSAAELLELFNQHWKPAQWNSTWSPVE